MFRTLGVDGKKVRIDSGLQLKYPLTPDSRGRARVTVDGKTYYFGAHGSPASHAMYAAWAAELLRSGTAYKPSLRRDDAHEFIGEGNQRKPIPKPWLAASVVLGSLLLCASMIVSVWISSSRRAPVVDGLSITARELEYVRTLRKTASSRDELFAETSSRAAEILARISKEGLPDAPPPRRAAKPPIPPID